jgi:hypothetical protein
MMHNYERAILQVFKGLEVETLESDRKAEILDFGFLVHPAILDTYSVPKIRELLDEIKVNEINSTFHKSWSKIKDSSLEQLVMEQILHYITTYGFESLDIFDEATVYIPPEKLEVPELEEGITLTVIKAYTRKEIKSKVLKILQSGIALKSETIDDLITILQVTGVNDEEVNSIKNKEVLSILCERFNLVPSNPTEFLRYLIYKTTGKTLLIKDKETLENISGNVDSETFRLFKIYSENYDLRGLAEIFFRFKPIFLAFRKEDQLKPIINRIRRLATRYHKPMKVDALNEVTADIKKGKTPDLGRLSEVNTFRKIRLAYALNYRTLDDTEAIVYKIRNGKSWATEFDFEKRENARVIRDIILESIASDIRDRVYKKKVYIPNNINYTLPSTEKQFTGNFPSGTCITLEKDMMVGIHWSDFNYVRVDLDLSLLNASNKIGWDGYYRDEAILFSGDMTSAPPPHGASEFFYASKKELGSYLVSVNYYNYRDDLEIPFDIIVACNPQKNLEYNYTVNPNNVIAMSSSVINKRQKTLGLLVITGESCKFYFSEANLGNSITAGNKSYSKNARKYLMDSFRNSIELKDILEKAGSYFVEERGEADIDLSPEALEKDTILNIFIKEDKR